MAKFLTVSQIANGAAVVADTNYTFTSDSHKVKSVHIVWTSTTSSATATLQFSNNNSTWENFTSAQSISNNSGSVFHKVDGNTDALYWRVFLDWTSGSVTTFRVFVAVEPRT